MSRIGSRIAVVRTARGMDRKQLGKLIGVSEKFIEEVETGKRVLNDDLQKRIGRVLGENIDELSIYLEVNEPALRETVREKKAVKPAVQEIWHDAFDSVIKTIRIYDYSLEKELGFRQLPVTDNRIEGFQKDKVAYIKIQDGDMIGFRILKGDLAFAHISAEISGNAICLVEYGGKRAVRQLRKLENDKILLVHNKGTLATETIASKDLKIIAKLVKLEITL